MQNSKENRLAAALAPTADCMEIDQLALVLEGRRGEQPRSLARDHVAGCAYCSAELALLQQFESPAILASEQAHVDAIAARLRGTSPASPMPWWKGWLDQFWSPRVLGPVSIGFAALFIAITLGVQSRHSPVGPVILPEHEVTRSQSVTVIAPVGDQTQTPRELQWRPATGAARYAVRLMEVDKTELWSTTVSRSSTPLPPDIAPKIVPLKTLMWEVTALDASGSVLASSGLQIFRLPAK